MLYIVGTSLGNMEDFTLRQARIILSAPVLCTEDTRSTGSLLPRLTELFGVQPVQDRRIISFHKENEYQRLPEVLDILADGTDVAVISEAGMPLISDPGYLLVAAAVKRGIPFTVIPGPTAATTALVYSGYDPAHHLVLGFLPKKESEILKLFAKLQVVKEQLPGTVFICYESPERIRHTLTILATAMPGTEACVCRELTKKFEEVVRGAPTDLAERDYKGEITLLFR